MVKQPLLNEAEVKATWAPIIESATGIQDKGKLSWMAKYCHFHKIAEDSGMVEYGNLITESIYNQVHLNPGMNVPGMGPVKFPGNPGTTTQFHSQTPGSGDKPFSLLPLSMQVAAQTVGLDMVPVVPLGGPFGMLTYLDFPYAGGNLATPSAVVNGLGGADGRVAPLMVKVNITWVTGYTPAANDVLYAKTGATFPYKFTYVDKSRIDGYSILKVEANQVAAMTVGGPFHAGYDNGVTLADIFTAGTTYDLVDAASVVLANAPEGPAELVKALEDHVTAFSGRGFKSGNVSSNDPYLREEGESTPDNLIGLKLFNKSVKAGTLQVAAAVTREQIQDLKQYGIDAVAQVEAVLVNELTQGINKHILERIFRLGNTNAQQVFNLDGTNLSLVVAAAAGTTNVTLGLPMDSDLTANNVILATTHVIPTAGDNTGTLQRKIMSRILAASNLIAIRGRRGAANFAVTNGQVATALQDIAGFVPYPLANTVNQNSGSLYPIGSIAGVNIFVDPNMSWTDTRIAVGRKGDGNSPGLVFMPYLMAEAVSTIAEGTMAPKIAVKSRYALVEAGFHPQTMYYTLGVEFQGYAMV